MSKFQIGDRVYYYDQEDECGIIMGFDYDGDPRVLWDGCRSAKKMGYYDGSLVLVNKGSWADFEERIKERLF